LPVPSSYTAAATLHFRGTTEVCRMGMPYS